MLLLAELAKSVGITGLVASPQELGILRERFGSLFTTVIPGIRPAWSESGDQKRILTPRQAVEAGADYLVIGRPITASDDPRRAVQRIVDELEKRRRNGINPDFDSKFISKRISRLGFPHSSTLFSATSCKPDRFVKPRLRDPTLSPSRGKRDRILLTLQ